MFDRRLLEQQMLQEQLPEGGRGTSLQGGLTSPQEAEAFIQALALKQRDSTIGGNAYNQGVGEGKVIGREQGIEEGKQMEKDRRKELTTNAARNIVEKLDSIGQDAKEQAPMVPQNASEQYAMLQGK